MLDVLLTLDSGNRGRVLFVIDEHLHMMLFRKPVSQSLAVLVNATDEIVGHTNVKRPPRTARQNIQPIGFHAGRQHGLPGQARQ